MPPLASPTLPTPLHRWRLLALVLLLWTVLASGWSCFLIASAYEGFVRATLRDRAAFTATLLQNPRGASQKNLLSSVMSDPAVAYAMLWREDGRVLGHVRDDLENTFLDVKLWPALEPGQKERIARFTTARVAEANLRSVRSTPVIEITLPVVAPLPPPPTSGASPVAAQRVFLSIAYDRDDLFRRYMPALVSLGIYSATFILLGGILLAAALLVTFRRLDRSRREIEQTARARTSLLTERGMLASVLAHEVRSPLTALRFNLHALRSLIAASVSGGSGEDKRLELTDRCEREIRRLDGMLNDFLQRTQVVTPSEPADVNAVVREAVEFLMPALERSHIRISLHLDESAPRVHVHPDELRQVILNLSANAMEAMPAPKGGTLAISTLVPPGANGDGAPSANEGRVSAQLPAATAAPVEGMITLLFRDSGVGIPAARLERIFEPFFSTKPNGSGLGLTLVRRVVSGAGGTVFVESKAGEGTTFRILLPAASAVR